MKFDTEELHFDVDEKGHPTRCYFKRSKDANKLIEEFMLLANRTVAESVGRVPKGKKAKVFPYRIHDNPDPEKMETLRQFIVKFGYKVKTDGTRGAMAKSINKLMDECEGKREQKLVQSVALRAMMKAKYSVHNIGHFGLGFEYYTHFTSPIRRYPDTMVHRLLTKYQQGGRSANEKHYEELCEHCSDMEQIAQNAERDSIKYKMVEFMGDHIGVDAIAGDAADMCVVHSLFATATIPRNFVIAKDGDDGKTDAPSASSQHDDTRAAISDMGNIAAEAAKSKARHQGKGRRGSGKKKK